MMKHLRVIILPAKYLEKHISKKVLIERIRYYYFPLRTFGAGFMDPVEEYVCRKDRKKIEFWV